MSLLKQDGRRVPRHDLSLRNKLNATHNMTDTPTWNSWKAMRDRCLRVTDKDYANYGGRGIKICQSWHSFESFFSDMGLRPEGKTLGRVDNNGNYTKDNCKWESSAEQARNKRVNRYIEYKGQKKTLAEWAIILNTSRQCIRYRLEAGWDIEDILSPVFDRSLKRMNKDVNSKTS